MVSLLNFDCISEAENKRRRTERETQRSVQPRQTARHRKQKIMSRLCDSGFEEDIGSSAVSPLAQTGLSPPGPDGTQRGELSTWYVQYGDAGYKIQREREAQLFPCKCLARQPQVDAEARCKLVSWLIPVHKHFGLSFECCCLAVNIMDRFLASTPVAADCFQLLGVTALLLASKQVEIGYPQISHLLSMCCDAFTKDQLCNLECLILVRLKFRLAAPTVAFFLDYYLNCLEDEHPSTAGSHALRPRRRGKLAKMVCELSLADYAFNKYPPSLTAHCAVKLAAELLNTEPSVDHTPKSQGEWSSLTDELCENKSALADGVSMQAADGSEVSDEDAVEAEDRILSPSREGFTHSLAQECRENLKLLVSLNLESLQGAFTM